MLTAVFAFRAFCQDSLPNISVKNISNQIVISWRNNYGAKISNINIQRSNDSLKNFTTIGTVLNPLNKENGYVDRRAASSNMFYRVFVAFEGGTYFFSRSHKPVIELPVEPAKDTTQKTAFDFTLRPTLVDTITSVNQAISDNSASETTIANNKVAGKTVIPPPVLSIPEDLIPARKFPPKPKAPAGFVPSKFIFVNRENNLIINLQDVDKEHFSLKFFDEKNKPVFEIKKISEPYLTVEKVNFLHTGWFYYQLYNDEVLLEKYKFYIGKDGWSGQPPPENKKITQTDQ
jgi:hypothetical protein